jgi:hypothetical protein
MLIRALWVAAVVNVVAALSAIAAPALHYQLLYNYEGPINDAAMASHVMLWLFIGLFGVGYGLAARDQHLRPGVLFLGGAGKSIAAALWLVVFVRGNHSLFLVQGVLFDGVFGVFFLVNYFRTARA